MAEKFETQPISDGDDEEYSNSSSSSSNENSDEDTDDSEDDIIQILSSKFSFTAEVEKILRKHQYVDAENTLALNKEMQKMLGLLRSKIHELLAAVRAKYKQNEELLLLANRPIRRSRVSHLYAAPFFKDRTLHPSWPNSDYLHRRDAMCELFPINLMVYPNHYWKMNDKVALIQGIKKQAIRNITGNNIDVEETEIQTHLKTLKQLLTEVDDKFEINWEEISHDDLNTAHSESACYAMWNGYLREDLNRSDWTPVEDDNLFKIAQKYNCQDWISIGREVGQRSDYQCFVRYQTVVFKKKTVHHAKNKWTKTEDELLHKLVEENTMGNNVVRWNHIFTRFENRERGAVFNRYMYSIHPGIKKGHFTPAEDCIIMAAVEEYGEHFSCFPLSLLPGRTNVQVRCRYYNTLKSSSCQKFWTLEDDKYLIHLVNQHGPSNWSKIEQAFKKQHTRTSCRTRYNVIVKYFADNPEGNIANVPRKKRGTNAKVSYDNWKDKFLEIMDNSMNKPKPKAVQKYQPKETYRDKLRKTERGFYELFKYSYDYTFGKDITPSFTSNVNGLYTMKTTLKMHPTAAELSGLLKPFPPSVILAFQKFENPRYLRPKIIEQSKVSPNWSTLLGFRALCILNASDGKEKPEKKTANTNPQNEFKFNPAKFEKSKQLLKERLFALMYNTAALSRFSPKDITSISRYTVKFSQSTPAGSAAIRNMHEHRDSIIIDIAENVKKTVDKVDSNRGDSECTNKRRTSITNVESCEGKKRVKVER